MDDKNIKECINISNKLDESILEGFKRGKDFKKESKRKNKVFKSAIKVAGMAFVITAGVITVKPELVEAIPGVSNVFEIFKGRENYKYKEYAKGMEFVKEDNGVSIKLQEIAMDERKFVATFIAEGEEVYGNNIDVEINTNLEGVDASTSSREVIRLDKNKVAVLYSMDISDGNLNDIINTTVNCGGIIRDGDELNGNWEMKFKFNRDDILVNTKNIKVDRDINFSNEILKIEDLMISPLGSTLNISFKSNSNDKDNIGKFHYIIKDDKGRFLNSYPISGVVNEEDGRKYIRLDIADDITDSKYINVIPVKTEDGNIYREYGEGKDSRLLNSTIGSGNEIIKIKTKDNFGYYNINKKEFYKLEELVGKEIKVNKTNSIVIKNINDNEMTVKINGYYDRKNLSGFEFIDEDLNVFDMGSEASGLSVDDKSGEITFKIPALDKSKKYNIAFPAILDLEYSDSEEIKINNN
ncbi:MAG: DUF4179 domain-containing protein [Clostridium baratii]|uniref:DUF4179 domain-containing protein n=1 Tax=Clostridium baratii TaxID=1561 RepID=UPI00242CF248|nr:DUF4179 domain-containing protein [Clostridium baratii]MBS6042164.1 DUF4179 domain-containing protein [Clostridium baratii]